MKKKLYYVSMPTGQGVLWYTGDGEGQDFSQDIAAAAALTKKKAERIKTKYSYGPYAIKVVPHDKWAALQADATVPRPASAKEIEAAFLVLDSVFERHNRNMILLCAPILHANYDLVLTAQLRTPTNSCDDFGKIEFCVCDGLPGERSTAHSYYDLEEALRAFQDIQQKGWPQPDKENR